MANVKFTDNSSKVLNEFEKAKKQILKSIGTTAERFAKKDSDMPVVTGRARNSIAWATKETEGKTFTYFDKYGKRYNDKIGSGAEKDSVYIGSNVEYFPFIEVGSRNRAARHILQKAVTTHPNEYQDIVKKILKD